MSGFDFFKICIYYFASIKRPDVFLKVMSYIDEQPFIEKYFNDEEDKIKCKKSPCKKEITIDTFCIYKRIKKMY